MTTHGRQHYGFPWVTAVASQPSPFFSMCPPALWRWPARPFDYLNQITEHLHAEPFPGSLCPLEERPESSPCRSRSSGACSPALPSASCLYSSDTDPWLFLSGLPSRLLRGFTWTPFPSRDGPLPLTFIILCHLSLHQLHLPNHAINRNSLYPCAQQNCFVFSHLLII